MNSKKIGISQPWSSRSMSSSLKEEIWIRKLVEGVFSNYNYASSEIYINFFPSCMELKFLLFIPGNQPVKDEEELIAQKEHTKRIKSIVKLVKSILVLKYNINVVVDIKRVATVFKDGKVLSAWLKNQIEKDPLRVLPTLRKTIEYRLKKSRHVF